MNPTNMLELQKLVLENVSENKSLFEKELRKSFKWLNNEDLQNLYHWAIGKFTSPYRSIIECVFISFKFKDYQQNTNQLYNHP